MHISSKIFADPNAFDFLFHIALHIAVTYFLVCKMFCLGLAELSKTADRVVVLSVVIVLVRCRACVLRESTS